MGGVPRRRQARSLANDAAILGAVVGLLDATGWEGCSTARIAAEAGVSRPTVVDRYEHRAGAVAAAWIARLAPVMVEGFARCIHSVDTIGPTDPTELLRALAAFFAPEANMRAAGEVLLVSRYDDRLATAVSDTLELHLDAWLSPRRGRLDRAQAARHASVLMLALGMLFQTRTGHHLTETELAPDLAIFADALSTRATPQSLPQTRATYLELPPEFTDADPALSRLLAATLTEVGERGYEAATLQRIARASGSTKGLVFSRYQTKRELFLDATSRMLKNSYVANSEFVARVGANATAGVADAVMLREFLRPELKHLRTITTEQYRLAWHDPEVQTTFIAVQDDHLQAIRAIAPRLSKARARARAFLGLSRGAGIMLTDLHPGVWRLPLDVVSIPLNESASDLPS